ncbi:MAG: four helix bundle protein [Merismopedia sp. SIO2A8]|nr:four helix bundle protein [Merismopedia sp. SIO2A8]
MLYLQFLHISLGSLRELDTQLLIAQRVKLAENKLFLSLINEVEEMQKILVATVNKLKT